MHWSPVFCPEAVIRACGQAAEWQQALQMLSELTTSQLEVANVERICARSGAMIVDEAD